MCECHSKAISARYEKRMITTAAASDLRKLRRDTVASVVVTGRHANSKPREATVHCNALSVDLGISACASMRIAIISQQSHLSQRPTGEQRVVIGKSGDGRAFPTRENRGRCRQFIPYFVSSFLERMPELECTVSLYQS